MKSSAAEDGGTLRSVFGDSMNQKHEESVMLTVSHWASLCLIDDHSVSAAVAEQIPF